MIPYPPSLNLGFSFASKGQSVDDDAEARKLSEL